MLHARRCSTTSLSLPALDSGKELQQDNQGPKSKRPSTAHEGPRFVNTSHSRAPLLAFTKQDPKILSTPMTPCGSPQSIETGAAKIPVRRLCAARSQAGVLRAPGTPKPLPATPAQTRVPALGKHRQSGFGGTHPASAGLAMERPAKGASTANST